MGIEPTWPAWKAGALPLSYTRMWSGRRDSDPRHPPWQGGTLPLSYYRISTHLRRVIFGADEETRTLTP